MSIIVRRLGCMYLYKLCYTTSDIPVTHGCPSPNEFLPVSEDGWTSWAVGPPCPTILGQLDQGSNHLVWQLATPLDGWIHRRKHSPPKAPTPHVLDMSKTPTWHRQKCQHAIVWRNLTWHRCASLCITIHIINYTFKSRYHRTSYSAQYLLPYTYYTYVNIHRHINK